MEQTKASHVRFRHSCCFLFIALLTLPGLGHASSASGEIEIELTEESPLFGYRGRIAPEFWGSLDPDWALCADGTEQSPIDLRPIEMTAQALADPEFSYHPTPAHVSNNGHTVQVNYEMGSTMVLDGKAYDLLQFHFHTPSEHSLSGGARFPLELHLVHRSSAGALAVVGVLIQESGFNRGLPTARTLKQVLPVGQGVEVQINEVSFDASFLLPEDLRSYRYAGSLTTPPCSEGVSWIVLAQPVGMSHGQMQVVLETLNQLRYASTEGNNARPTQSLGDREVVLGDN